MYIHTCIKKTFAFLFLLMYGICCGVAVDVVGMLSSSI